MLLITLFLSFFLFGFGFSLPDSSEFHGLDVTSGVPEGYRAAPMQWQGILEEGGPEHTFNGTIEQVEAQIKALKPDFDWATAPGSGGLGNGLTLPDDSVEGDCDWGYSVLQWRIDEQIAYLRSLTGRCKTEANSCVRVSCSYRAGVWVCNNNNDHDVTPLCTDVAEWALWPRNICGHRTALDGYREVWVRGKVYNKEEGYNVHIGDVKC